ncbi:hypothetical protein AMTR_s00052p00219110, partial [Amborella trichopoda]
MTGPSKVAKEQIGINLCRIVSVSFKDKSCAADDDFYPLISCIIKGSGGPLSSTCTRRDMSEKDNLFYILDGLQLWAEVELGGKFKPTMLFKGKGHPLGEGQPLVLLNKQERAFSLDRRLPLEFVGLFAWAVNHQSKQ